MTRNCAGLCAPWQELEKVQAQVERLKAAAPKAVRQSKVRASSQQLNKQRRTLNKLEKELEEAENQLKGKRAELAQLVAQ